MNTKLIILGSGNSSGVPRIDGDWGKCDKKNIKNHRTRCSAVILKGSNIVLIDTSPDIRKQFLDNKIKNVSSVLFTHNHADQTNGLFELRPFLWKNNKKINVYGNAKTISSLKKKYDYCFKKTSSYPPIAKPYIVKKNFYLGEGKEKIYFQTTEAKHGSIKVVLYVFEKTAYISDCNDLSIVNFPILKNLDNLIIDCLTIKKNWAHFNLNDSLYIHRSLKPKKTILTNLRGDLDYDLLKNILPKNVVPAYDGLKIDLK